MKRLFQSLILIILAIPAFTGLGLNAGPQLLLNISLGRIIYLCVTSGAIFALRGFSLWRTAIIFAVIILIPIVFGGILIALIIYALEFGDMGLADIAAHYIFLFINMLTMIPLGLALVSLIPFAAIETRLLKNTRGVSKTEKVLLMAMRVFNHVLFAVMPEIVQAAWEELRFNKYMYKNSPSVLGKRRLYLHSTVSKLKFVAITAVCTSLKYVHFWTAEISSLPDKKEKGK